MTTKLRNDSGVVRDVLGKTILRMQQDTGIHLNGLSVCGLRE